MTETVTLTLPVYRTPAGRHTCAVDVEARQFCPLLVVRFGGYVCAWPRLRPGRDWVYDHQDGYTIPVRGCPVAAALDMLREAP